MRETYLYPYSAEEACRRGEQSLWRASYLENIDCKDAIQKAVRQHYDGAHLDKECLTGVLQEFGYRKAQADMRQAVAVKANIDHLLGHADEQKNKAQER